MSCRVCLTPACLLCVVMHRRSGGPYTLSAEEASVSLKHIQINRVLWHCNYRAESCMKHLRHAVWTCMTRHRCTCTHKVRHTFPLTAFLWHPPRLLFLFFFHSFNFRMRRGDNSVCLAQSTMVNEHDLYWIKHWVRIPNAHSAELNVSLRSKKRIKKGIY